MITLAVTMAHLSAGNVGMLLLSTGMIIAVWSVSIWFEQHRARNGGACGSLFDELALAHGLDESERAILKRAAELADFEESSFVFVRPEALDAVEAEGEFDPASIASLRERLFDDEASAAALPEELGEAVTAPTSAA